MNEGILPSSEGVSQEIIEQIIAKVEGGSLNVATIMGRIERLVPEGQREQVLTSVEVQDAMADFVIAAVNAKPMGDRLALVPEAIRSDVMQNEKVRHAMVKFVLAAGNAAPMKARLAMVPAELQEIVASDASIQSVIG